jgi:hypothetical protein
MYQMTKNVPNGHKIHQLALKLKNRHKIFQDGRKNTKIALKYTIIYHIFFGILKDTT